MKDRQPKYPGRVSLRDIATGETKTYDMTMADEPTVEGDAPVKKNLLEDAVAELYGGNSDTVINDILKLLYDSAFRVGDIRLSRRESLGDNWLLCNGEPFNADEYSELSAILPVDPSSVGNYQYDASNQFDQTTIFYEGLFYRVVLDGTTRIQYSTDLISWDEIDTGLTINANCRLVFLGSKVALYYSVSPTYLSLYYADTIYGPWTYVSFTYTYTGDYYCKVAYDGDNDVIYAVSKGNLYTISDITDSTSISYVRSISYNKADTFETFDYNSGLLYGITFRSGYYNSSAIVYDILNDNLSYLYLQDLEAPYFNIRFINEINTVIALGYSSYSESRECSYYDRESKTFKTCLGRTTSSDTKAISGSDVCFCNGYYIVQEYGKSALYVFDNLLSNDYIQVLDLTQIGVDRDTTSGRVQDSIRSKLPVSFLVNPSTINALVLLMINNVLPKISIDGSYAYIKAKERF